MSAELRILIIILLLALICLISFCQTIALTKQKDKNKDLQLENSDLIDRNICLQDEVKEANKAYLKLNSRMNNALDLLETQNGLLNENNIKH
jgi:hypothetical protein